MVVGLKFGIFGPTIHQGHLTAFLLVIYLIGIWHLPKQWKPLAMLPWIWLFVAAILFYIGRIPSGLYITRLDGTLMLMFATAWAMFVYRAPVEKETWINLLCISALIEASIGLCQFFLFDPVSTVVELYMETQGDFSFRTPTGLTGNPNYLSAVCSFALPLFFRRNWFYGLLLIVPAMLVTKSTGGFASGAIAVAYYFLGFKGVIVGFIAGTAHYLSTHNWISEERPELWLQTMRLFLHSWVSVLLGYGPGIVPFEKNATHCEYLTVLFSYGVVGFGMMLNAIRTAWSRDRMLNASVMAILANCIVNHPFHIVAMTVFALTILMLNVREGEEDARLRP